MLVEAMEGLLTWALIQRTPCQMSSPVQMGVRFKQVLMLSSRVSLLKRFGFIAAMEGECHIAPFACPETNQFLVNQ